MISVKESSFKNEPTPVKFEINEAKEGSSFVLNNLYYNTNSADLTKESFIVLESFAEYLKENPNLEVIIGAPAMGDVVRLGIRKPDQGFNEVLSKIHAANYKSNLADKLSRK